MLEFNDRQASEPRPLRLVDDGISFVVRYAAPRTAWSARLVECEKRFQAKNAALNFCVILRNLGGKPTELLRLIQGQADAVLDGQDLEEAIDCQRTRLNTEAIPPWR